MGNKDWGELIKTVPQRLNVLYALCDSHSGHKISQLYSSLENNYSYHLTGYSEFNFSIHRV